MAINVQGVNSMRSTSMALNDVDNKGAKANVGTTSQQHGQNLCSRPSLDIKALAAPV
jgi:hypothetical protein